MEINDVIESMELKFTSGNTIDVSRSSITREEWEVLRKSCQIPKKSIDEQMKDAGMMSVDQMMDGLTKNPFMLQAEVVDRDSFESWLESKCREYSKMQANLQLSGDDEDEMFEWTLAHAAVYKSVLSNLRKVKELESK